MLPQNVGEIKRLIADLPDDMLFDLDVTGFAAIDSANLDVSDRSAGWDGTKCRPIMRKMLILKIHMEE